MRSREQDTEHVSKVIERIESELFHVHSTHNTFKKLFLSDEKTRNLLADSDMAFFHDLHVIYLNYISVVIARLLDPESTGKKKNLTLFYLIHQLKFLNIEGYDTLFEKLQTTKKKAYNFTEPRNQLVAHLDFDINFLGDGKCVPSFTSAEFDEIYQLMGEIVNEVRSKIGAAPTMFKWGILNHGCGRKLMNRLELAASSL